MSRKQLIHAPISASFDDVLGTIGRGQEPITISAPAKPFLKWVGGKRSILPTLIERMPAKYTNYYEPFIGGGALFFSLQPEKAFISDTNLRLIMAYNAIRDNVEGVIELLKQHKEKHNKAYYLEARKNISLETQGEKVAALLIYLNKTCYNGLYRVNRAGEFNVPIGDYTAPAILDEDTLRADSEALQGVKTACQEFHAAKVEKGAFYYFDPPYHQTYNGYGPDIFGDDKHTALAEFCGKIHAAGGLFMLSNSDTPFVRNLYKKYHTESVSASRSVSCKVNRRGKENELLICNYQRD